MKLSKLIRKSVPSSIRQSELVAKLRLMYNYRFNLSSKLNKQLTFENELNMRHEISTKKILLPIIETNHYQHFQLLIFAKALEIRGAKVKILICGQTLEGCEVKSVKMENTSDPCMKCRFNENNILPLFNFDVIRFKDIFSSKELEKITLEATQKLKSMDPIEEHDINLDGTIDDSILRYFYGNIPDDKQKTDSIKLDHTITALTCIKAAKRIDEEWKPDIVLNNMYSYSAWEPFFNYYLNNGNRFKSLSLRAFDYNTLMVDRFEIWKSTNRFKKYLKHRNYKPLKKTEKKTIDNFFKKRFRGDDPFLKEYDYFNNSSDEDLIKKHLKIDKNKRNIFLFSNVFWDVGLSDCGDLYDDVVTWVIDTIKIIKKYPECHLYIKIHPAEVYFSGSLKTVRDFIYDTYQELPDNVSIIDPEWKIPPYKLFPFIDLGVIFYGTLGLEMMYADTPVVSTGRTVHHKLGLAMEPKNRDEYISFLTEQKSQNKIDRKKLELFLYFFFYKTHIPWNLTKQAYKDKFDGYLIKNLNDLEPGKNPELDHLCSCMLDSENTVVEGWNFD